MGSLLTPASTGLFSLNDASSDILCPTEGTILPASADSTLVLVDGLLSISSLALERTLRSSSWIFQDPEARELRFYKFQLHSNTVMMNKDKLRVIRKTKYKRKKSFFLAYDTSFLFILQYHCNLPRVPHLRTCRIFHLQQDEQKKTGIVMETFIIVYIITRIQCKICQGDNVPWLFRYHQSLLLSIW